MKQLQLKPAENIQPVDLKGELKKRFLWYAISTIAARALPDVRDGLKPVHRRLLYAMYRMKLGPESRFRKSAAVVGDVLGKYHPHGDQAAYDTLVRLAQPFTLRYPLIEGQGNFGSIDGDSAAAMRYTEARLSPLAMEVIREIEQNTAPFRPNYDSTLLEPVFLPSRIPNLLINGSAGIAVGMATNIPPHNLTEVIKALVALIDDPSLTTSRLLKFIKGPDFPTGGLMITGRKELLAIYEEGRGSIKVRGEWKTEKLPRGRKLIVITSIPYGVNKSRLVEKIAQIIIDKKIPAFYDVRDESDEEMRVVIEIKGELNIDKAMAFVYRYTDLEQSFAANLTALDPNNIPRRMSLLEMLKIFLQFRFDTVRKRLEFDLGKILDRLHILRGLLKVLVDLENAIILIRRSKSRDEARRGLMRKFGIDEKQANAVLDLRLSSLVSLEIKKITDEAETLDMERKRIEAVLGSAGKLKTVVRNELLEIVKTYGDKRKTLLAGAVADEEEYSEADFIAHEKCFVIVSRNGWVRRIRKEPNRDQLRFRENDSLMNIIPMDTSEHICFFSSAGRLYVIDAYKLQQTTGFGEPVQSIFKFGDGEKLVAVSRMPHIASGRRDDGEFLVVMENGSGFRLRRGDISETTRAGRRFANLKQDNAVLYLLPADKSLVYIAGSGGKGLLFRLEEVPVLSGPGAGVRLIKLKEGDRIIGVRNVDLKSRLRLVFDTGRPSILKIGEMEPGRRAGAGRSYGGLRKKLMAVVDE
jgi:DNA gyrase subunit A